MKLTTCANLTPFGNWSSLWKHWKYAIPCGNHACFNMACVNSALPTYLMERSISCGNHMLHITNVLYMWKHELTAK